MPVVFTLSAFFFFPPSESTSHEWWQSLDWSACRTPYQGIWRCLCRGAVCHQRKGEAKNFQSWSWSTLPQTFGCSLSKDFLWAQTLSLLSMVCSSLWSGVDARERSSSNSRWVTVKSGMPVITPCTPSARLSTSFRWIENRRGKRGHPCLTPKDGCTFALLFPSSIVYSPAAWYKPWNMDTICWGIWQ